MSRIKITQVKSGIDRMERQKRTLRALGLRKMLGSVEVEATSQIMGMVKTVHHLVKVEPATGITTARQKTNKYPRKSAWTDAGEVIAASSPVTEHKIHSGPGTAQHADTANVVSAHNDTSDFTPLTTGHGQDTASGESQESEAHN